MKKRIVVGFLFVILCSSVAFAGGKVKGKVKYSSGTTCSGCKVEINSEGGWQTTKTDGNGRYSISVKGCYVNDVYVNGKKVWSGAKDSCGGLTLDLKAK